MLPFFDVTSSFSLAVIDASVPSRHEASPILITGHIPASHWSAITAALSRECSHSQFVVGGPNPDLPLFLQVAGVILAFGSMKQAFGDGSRGQGTSLRCFCKMFWVSFVESDNICFAIVSLCCSKLGMK